MSQEKDEVLKGYSDREKDLGKLMQERYKLLDKYDKELIDVRDPSMRSEYERRRCELHKEINTYQEEIKKLGELIKERLSNQELLNKSFFDNSSPENREVVQSDDKNIKFLSQITNPLIKEIETRLRNDPSYWRSGSFPLPRKSESYTASYFSYVWENINSFRGQLEMPDCQRQRLILEELLNQVFQISQLVKITMPYQPYDLLTIELSKIEAAIKAVEKDFRKVEFIKLSGSSPPLYLLEAINTKIAALKILIIEIQEQIQALIDEAYRAMPFIS
jgi:hypothetical protein